jgi:hypothetical protein
VWGEQAAQKRDLRVLANEKFVVVRGQCYIAHVDEHIYPWSEFVHGHGDMV